MSPVLQGVPAFLRLLQRLSRRWIRRLFGTIPDRTVSYHNGFAAEGRRRFCRKERSQYREHLRSECDGNDHDRCCTFHVARSYQIALA
jgi:hypothetical protein